MIETIRARRAVTALTGEVWALEPRKLEQVADFAQALIEGRATNGDLFAQVAGESEGEAKPYTVTGDGVAVISVNGVIARRLNLFSSISGGTSTELLGAWARKAGDDPGVRAIVMDINSPGGGVFGLTDLVGTIRTVRQVKPVVAFTAELMCSAAYWIGSAADEMVCTVDAEVGSFGVACMHIDRSGADEKAGVKRTMLSAGKYKRIASDEKPLSDEGREYLQQRVDHYYTLFVDAVAENRSMSVEDVLENLADGSTHIGKEALARGFVNFVGNMEFALARALVLADNMNSINSTQEADMPGTTPQGAGADNGGSATLDLSAITAEQLANENPDLAAHFTAAGANDERARCVALLEAGADSKLTLAAVKEGTESGEFYKQALEAERTGKAEALKDFEQDLSESAGMDGKESDNQSGADFDAMVEAHMKDAGCSKGKAVLAVARKNPAAHAAWLAANN